MVDENTSNSPASTTSNESTLQDNSQVSQPTQDTQSQSQAQPTTPAQPTPQSPTPSSSPVDVESIKAEVSKGVTETVKENIKKVFGLSEKEKEELPTDADSLQKLVDEKVKQQLEQYKTQEKQEKTQSEQQYQEKVKEIQSGWFNQYDILARAGKVPLIKDPNDVNDAGVLARRKIIIAIGKQIETLRAEGNTYIPSISDIILQNPNVLRSEVPGADLPISGNTATTQPEFSNQEIRNKSMAQIASESN